MADLDAELLDRVARWCAEAGRQAGAGEIRRALEPLKWDQLLAVRALLADPPPARPLGPQALADLARGTPADVAAEREREGRYRAERGEDDAPPPAVTPPARPDAPARRRRAKARPALVIRRARDRAIAPAPAAPAHATLDDLRRPEGRAELERLLRRHGARRRAVAAALGERWRRADGSPPGEEDLAALLDHHGIAHAFEHRERDELLHAVRAAGGLRAAAAERLGLDEAGLEAAVARLSAQAEVERIRADRRAELRARATLAERVRLLLGDEPRLRDLGLLEEFEQDLRARLPEHFRALRVGREPLLDALAVSLSLPPGTAAGLAERLGLDLGPRREGGARPGAARAGRPPGRAERPGRPTGRPGRPERPGRPAGRPERPGRSAAGAARPGRPARPERGGGRARPGGAAVSGGPRGPRGAAGRTSSSGPRRTPAGAPAGRTAGAPRPGRAGGPTRKPPGGGRRPPRGR